MSAQGDAANITRASKSNLALAFISMSGKRRRDITTFYAFCRLIDDIGDDPQREPARKRHELEVWRESLRSQVAKEPALASSVRALMSAYRITPGMLEEVITGVEMDVAGQRYSTWEELRVYCYRVASAVGLVSIEIFGYTDPRCRDYAVQLGLALQLTNIIRDVGIDLEAGRIYLPEEDMARFQYRADELVARIHNERFVQLMEFEAARAQSFFKEARRLLPPPDRRAMLPAEIMRSVYQALLRKISRDGFHVFQKRYRLTGIQKSACIAAEFLTSIEWRSRRVRLQR